MFRKRRRARIKAQPFPAAWREIIDEHMPYFPSLSPEDQSELCDHIQVFLAEKPFEGCGDLTITDEMRVTIAAHACVLLLHRDTDYYPELKSILVYPSTYVATMEQRAADGTVSEVKQARLGETGSHNLVVLAWDYVLRSAHKISDGYNVVFHEFAHQLDMEDGVFDGTPELVRPAMYGPWAETFEKDYYQLMRADKRGKETVIDKYGATNRAEFFAVVTETFFEKPLQLKKRHPKLYEQMKLYYRQDPAEARMRKR